MSELTLRLHGLRHATRRTQMLPCLLHILRFLLFKAPHYQRHELMFSFGQSNLSLALVACS